MRLISLLVLSLLANTLFGQTGRVVYELADLVDARTVDGRLFCDRESKPTIKPRGLIEVPDTARNVVIAAIKLPNFDAGKVIKISDRQWLIEDSGKWIVGISGEGITTPLLVLDVQPTPAPGPGPTPNPDPLPPPTPSDIANEYNLGKLAFEKAPKGEVFAAQSLQKFYKDGADRVYGEFCLSHAAMFGKLTSRRCEKILNSSFVISIYPY